MSSSHLMRRFKPNDEDGGPLEKLHEILSAHTGTIFIFLLGAIAGLYLRGCFMKSGEGAEGEAALAALNKPTGPDIVNPARPAPDKFPRDAKMPNKKEVDVSMGIDDVDFSAGRDLVYVEDARVWWESDNDKDPEDDECDHSIHAAMEIPFRRLANLVSAAGWQLRVQEGYRATGIHADKSLHKQGRALDLTVERLGETKLTPFEKLAAYEALAKLVWQAGFDWVYYENSRGSGPHIHASVRPDGPKMADFKEGGK